ncbi:MAG: endonuclease/exonuclease/phosphatase family protein [Paracoccaceae bacterium]|nr:endonuclease/exonuclease/phosphatase family protein [Paracoccaceae bacterium]
MLLRDIASGKDAQVAAMTRLARRVDADVLILGGIDYDLRNAALAALADGIGGYPHRFQSRPNRGLQTGLDADGDGRMGEPEDAQGFGRFAGADGLAVISKHPLGGSRFDDFSTLRWTELADNLALADVEQGQRLSTTAHWALSVSAPGAGEVDLLIWHAAPPVFDGPDDRNGRRNHDEAAFWAWYLEGADPDRPVILAGLANLDVVDGDGRPEAMRRLLGHPRLQDPEPASAGGVRSAEADGGKNASHRGDPALDTVDWPDDARGPGNLRVDFILPDRRFEVLDAGVLWPSENGPLLKDVMAASRHRIVWMDLRLRTPNDPA